MKRDLSSSELKIRAQHIRVCVVAIEIKHCCCAVVILVFETLQFCDYKEIILRERLECCAAG